MEKFKEWRHQRRALDMTLQQVAVKIGVSAPHLSNVEHGHAKLTPQQVRELERILATHDRSDAKRAANVQEVEESLSA